MDLVTRKYKLIESFMKIASVEQIEKLENFFKKEIAMDEFEEDLKQVLDISMKQIQDKKTFTSDSVVNEAKSKYGLK